MPLSSYHPDQYSALLQKKTEHLRQLLAPFDIQALDVYPSPVSGFRMRTEFRFWHSAEGSYYAMFPKGDSSHPVKIDHFPIAHDNINRLMKELHDAVSVSETLSRKLFQVEFLTTLKGESLITLIYHRKLDDAWLTEAQQLEQSLSTAIIGRSRQQRIIVSKDYVDETLSVNSKTLHYRQMEGGFTQPNAYINQNMLEWVIAQTGSHSSDLLELYCGNGNFTVALAVYFDKVLATEISKTSVKSAEYNFAKNHVGNVKICRMSSEDISAALNKEREFRRLVASNITLEDYRFSTVLVDPPRAGLDDATLTLIQRFDRILYISCNPQTLLNNLQVLTKTHKIQKVALFDQFPYTEHIETGVLLQRL